VRLSARPLTPFQPTHRTDFSELALSPDERTWLASACPFFTPSYLDYLASFRFDPAQVRVSFVPRDGARPCDGDIGIEAAGPWVEAILWEVPLMATLSEIYFATDEQDWNEDGQEGALRSAARVTFRDVGGRARAGRARQLVARLRRQPCGPPPISHTSFARLIST
jgi:nicotinic acid phosphoribosyltransferase